MDQSVAIELLRTHPHAPTAGLAETAELITAAMDGAVACMVCADACLTQAGVVSLVECIRINTDCAESCKLVGRMLACQTESDPDLVRRSVDLCALACRSCADICHGHEDLACCRVCREACLRCADACDRVLLRLGNNHHSG